MDYDKKISEMKTGDMVEGFYVLKAASIKIASNGGRFLAGTLSDNSGTVDIKVWDYSGPVTSTDAGRVVKIRGDVSEYRGTPQLTVSKIRLAQANEYDASVLVPTAPIDVEESMRHVETYIAAIGDDDYHRIAMTIFERHKGAFRTIPAAKTIHHSFLSGLLMHTLNMLQIAYVLADTYRDIIDRSLLLAGTLLHDIAKDREFAVSELGLATDYTIEGNLLGHLVMGAQEVSQVADELGIPKEKSVLLQHMILSHHGEPEYGSAVRPLCAEAELLHYIDLIDSRMELYTEAMANIGPGEFSTGRVAGLDHKIFNHG